MARIPIFVAVAVAIMPLVWACEPHATGDAATQPAASTAAAESAILLTGKDAYDRTCAGCHEEGVNGAPRTGDRDAWTNRSWLWEAVLFEHAKYGYMEMPARGGDVTLSDAEVERAAEYMLSKTFPDVQRSD